MKLMIISWIVFIVIVCWLRLLVNAMDNEERLVYSLTQKLPTRIAVFALLRTISFVESVTVTLIFVVKL